MSCDFLLFSDPSILLRELSLDSFYFGFIFYNSKIFYFLSSNFSTQVIFLAFLLVVLINSLMNIFTMVVLKLTSLSPYFCIYTMFFIHFEIF